MCVCVWIHTYHQAPGILAVGGALKQYVYVYVYVCAYVNAYAYVFVCVYVFEYVYAYVYVYVHVYIYITKPLGSWQFAEHFTAEAEISTASKNL
jgi:hypothetical protein